MDEQIKKVLEKYPHEDDDYILSLYQIHVDMLKNKLPEFLVGFVASARTEEDIINFS